MRGLWAAVATVLLLVGAVHRAAPQTAGKDPTRVGQWSAPVSLPLVMVHAHLLPNGKVLAWARHGQPVVWDVRTGALTPVPNPTTDVFCSGHSFLPDGRLLVTGGHIADGVGLPDTNLFSWTDNRWLPGPPMNAGRWYPTNCSLANGEQVVVSGNIDNEVGPDTLPQVWKVGGGWRDLPNARLGLPLYPFLHLAPNGRVFNAGPNLQTLYLDTVGKGQWLPVARSAHTREREYGSSVLYDTGRVLLIGGGDPPTNTCETIDLNQRPPRWRSTAPLAAARRHLNATLLPDGTVLVTGGSSSPGNGLAGARLAGELWDPRTARWTTLASMHVPRLYHSTALLLPDGRVLSGGGGEPPAPDGDQDHKDAEFYSPPYLFRGPRPRVTAAPAAVRYGQRFRVVTPDAAGIAQATWIRLPSVTHAFNMNQRINRLAFRRVPGGVELVAPATGALCPPGHYMLFLLNTRGVPSEAAILRIG